ncbi:Asp23/Gls24 family envelope stress response protein [Gemella sanguinis]|uniref:Asp23/Gls24 family envelope stress response protein n=1 Tax=Gemella sanguinis TaxID=84135 RepID=UPI0028E7AC44|nr:Asp23/Gls24 family envelope stress response protein [Gemella sanguinis]
MPNTNTNKKENEKKDVNKNVGEVKGELTYENKVIQKIIGFSLENISGLLAVDGGFFSNLTEKLINTDNVTSGVNVEVGKEQVAVDLDVIVEYKKNIPELYQEIKKVITNDISNITDLEVVEVNVNVVDIKTKEQHEADSVSLQDRVTNAVESTGEFASEKFEAAKTGISDGLSTAKEKVEDGIEAVKDKANDDDKEDEKASKSKEKKRVQ